MNSLTRRPVSNKITTIENEVPVCIMMVYGVKRSPKAKEQGPETVTSRESIRRASNA